jgi:hypothetical protein
MKHLRLRSMVMAGLFNAFGPACEARLGPR